MSDANVVNLAPRIAEAAYRGLLDTIGELPASNRCELAIMLAYRLPAEELARLRTAAEQFAHGAGLRLAWPDEAGGEIT